MKTDLQRLAKHWKLNELHAQLKKEAPHFIELGQLARIKGAVSDEQASLASLCGIILSHSFHKTNEIQPSVWSSAELTSDQKNYAAVNAYASWLIWKQLSNQPTIGLPLTTFIPGTLVNVQAGKNIVAHGHIINQPSQIQIQHAEGEKTINVSPSRVVIEVDEVTLPGYEPALYKLPLCQLGPPPFSLVTSKSMLRTRNSSPPAVPPITSADSFALPDDIAMYPPPQILHPDNIEQINQNIIRSSDFETDEESDDDDDDDDNSQNGSFSEFDAEKIAQQRNTIQQSMISEAPSASSFSTSTSGKNPSASSSSSKQLNSSNWEKTLSAASHSFPSLTQPSDKDLKAL